MAFTRENYRMVREELLKILYWKRLGLLPAAAIEQMVPEQMVPAAGA